MPSTAFPAAGLRAIRWSLGRPGEAIAGRISARMPWVRNATGHQTVRRAGFEWELDLADNLQRLLYFVGSYESTTVSAARSLARPTDVVLDVGANIGVFTLPLAADLRNGRVIAVEAASDTAAILRRHLARNGLSDRVTVVEAALSSRAGTARLHVSSYGGHDVGTRSLEAIGPATGTDIDVITADSLVETLGLARVDGIKIDVEGHESAVLAGMTGLLSARLPRFVIVEIVPGRPTAPSGSPEEIIRLLDGFGYDAHAIRAAHGVSPLPRPDWSGNVLFTRRERTAR